MHPHFNIGGRGFPLVERRIVLAGTAVNLATVAYSPAELDRIVDLVGLKERAWPYWLEDWPATYALAEVLEGEDPPRWPGPVLDLGCGSGILSAFLKLRFGIDSFGCDFNSDACRLAVLNARRNPPEPRPASGAPQAGAGLPGRVFCADFRAFPVKAAKGMFGLVLGGEMLYAAENQAPILTFLDRHLAPAGTALFADPGRSAAEGFREAAAAAGFAVTTRTVPVPAGDKIAQVYRLTRRTS